MQDLFFENVMLVSPTGAFTPNINDDITVNIIRYNLKLKFDKIPNMINIWLYINIPQTTATTENHISIVKYEIVKVLMDTILTENEPVDETLGIKSSGNMTISFKVAFNTLLNKKLLNKY